MDDLRENRLLPWFKRADEILSQAQQNERLAHGVLIEAPKGSGKLDYARFLSSRLLCTAEKTSTVNQCGQCKSCQLIESNSHPDFYLLDRLVDNKGKAKLSIGIDQVRSLTSKLAETAQMGGWRIAIIRSVSDLTTASFNALLKTLEEPGDKTLLVLLADNLQKVPATVKSRCQIIKPELTNSVVRQWLIEKHPEIAPELIEQVISESGFAPFRALEMVEGDYMAKRNHFYALLDSVITNRKTPSEVITDIELEEAEVWDQLGRYFYKVSRDKAEQNEWISNAHLLELPLVYNLYDKVVDYQRALHTGSNLQSKLQLQSILIQWYEIGRKLNHISNS